MHQMRCLVLALLVGAIACGGTTSKRAVTPRPRTPGVRISMFRLHQSGGVPPRWKLTPPPGDVDAGRAAFVALGCPSCHRVEGEPFSAKPTSGDGPDLTGMGAHHPPAYFIESILNPDAVLVEGEGYVGPDGHSIMPDYPDLTVQQLGDLVAYLTSLKTGGMDAGQVIPVPIDLPANPSERPEPPASPAKAYFIQSYDVKPDQLAAFEAWWKSEGAKRFLAVEGLLYVDTYVDYTRPEAPFTSLFAFRDGAAMQLFTRSPAGQALGLEFDKFIGDHGHVMQPWPPIYRVPGLSAPP